MNEPDPISIELRGDEIQMLRMLVVQLRWRLRGEPDDVAARLFPVVVRDDPATDRDARQLIHDDLLRERLTRLGEVLDLLPETGAEARVELVDDQPQMLMGVLNDLRLTLAVQAGLDREPVDREELDEETAQAVRLLDWLAWWQEHILRLLDPEALRFYEDESDLSA